MGASGGGRASTHQDSLRQIFSSSYILCQGEGQRYRFEQFCVAPRNVSHEEMSQEKSGKLILRMVPVMEASVHGGVGAWLVFAYLPLVLVHF